MKNLILLQVIILLVCSQILVGQNNGNNDGGQISGSLETNGNIFIRDSLIGAANTPQYDRQLFGADAWLNLTYSNWGFDVILRLDFFNNSNLLNPQDSYTAQGVGRFFINKKIHKLNISAGHIYDQIGSGIIFRAFEERPLLIDNSLLGVRLTYDLLPDWQLKVFTGRQKRFSEDRTRPFDNYDSIIKGAVFEGFASGGKEDGKRWSMAPGVGLVNRTLDDNSMNSVVATLNTYTKDDAFIPTYNTYAVSLYNSLTWGDFSWFVEGAYKTDDVLNDPFGEFVTDSTVIVGNKLVLEAGTVLYTSLSYARKGLGITLEAKRTESFSFRTRPQEQLNRGLVNFLPPMTRVNTYRLTSRYSAATQDLGELAFQGDIRYAPNRKLSFNVNVSNITDLDNDLLYRELYTEISYKYKRKWSILGGLQLQNYNQEIYEFKPDVPIVETVIPYLEYLYKINRKKAIRFEAQYMNVGMDEKADAKQDYGDWLFGLVEFSIAPNWTFTASDMYNVGPGKLSPVGDDGEKLDLHYPRFDVYYTHKSNRFSVSYVKQVEGIVCAGGICRLEPAFSGVKMTVNSTF